MKKISILMVVAAILALIWPNVITIMVLSLLMSAMIVTAIAAENAVKRQHSLLMEARTIISGKGEAAVQKTTSTDGCFVPQKVSDISFDCIRGMDETVKDIQEIVLALSKREELAEIGADVPHGIILYGPPGTGKTLMAKAIASEVSKDAAFFSVSGSDFIEKYVGVGASRIRELFAEAKKSGKTAFIFIDEIDAIGGSRGGESNTEKDSTLNQLLVEMDGFNGRDGIFVVAATNRLDILDSALLRPGRFDRQIAIPLPDMTGRIDIIKYFVKKYKVADDVDVTALATKTSGFSPAEIKGIINSAAVEAVAADKKVISGEQLQAAYWKAIMKGNPRRDKTRSTEENTLVAYHEAGHAVINRLVADTVVSEVTIIGSTSGAGGVTIIQPKEGLTSATDIRNKIISLYGGRAAEEILLGNSKHITTGASQDIREATSLIKKYIESWGMMSENGLLDYTVFKKDGYSIDDAVKLSQELYSESLGILRKNKDKLAALAEELIRKETLNSAEIDEICFGREVANT